MGVPEPTYQAPTVEDDDILISNSSSSASAAAAPIPSASTTPALTKRQALKKQRKTERKDRVLNLGRGPLLHTISPDSLQPVAEPVTWDADPELLCSYNWAAAEDGTNTLFVPGGPPRWAPRQLPCVLKGDSGFHPTDYNYVRQPKEPFSAVFHALGVMRPDFKWYV
jgi:hypothetical protein